MGGARQLLINLDTQRARQQELRDEQETLRHKQGQLRSLETAFGKDGVPAMLIEQALPELEAQANEILLKLSDNTMSLSFSTQREYKDKKRDDKRETLDIIISMARQRAIMRPTRVARPFGLTSRFDSRFRAS